MNATCAIHGHDWFWRFAMRLRMCKRCQRLDVSPRIDSPQGIGGRVDPPASPVAGALRVADPATPA